MTQTRRGDLKLSELASHLVLPDGIVSTRMPLVDRQLDRMGIRLDRWQHGLGTALLGCRADGQYACGVGGAVFSIPRQTGKTFTVGAIVFALCIIDPGTLVIWSAHRSRTHKETFTSMTGLAQRSEVAPFVRSIRRANGEQEVEFTNGSRILFGAREQGFGRGFAQVDVLVLDEAQILTEKAMEDMAPATNAAPNGLVVMMGTPPRPVDPGEVFSERRDSALSGEDVDTLYAEFSADSGCDLDDRGQWRKANPSFPARTSETSILRLRKLLGSASFMREALGVWDKTSSRERAFHMDVWGKRASASPVDGVKSFGVKFTVDGSHVALAGAVKPTDGPIFVEAIKQAPMSDGTQWLVDFLAERKSQVAQIVVDGKAGVGYLVNALRDAHVGKRVIITPSLDQVITAHSEFERAVVGGTVSHSGQPELDEQVECAGKRLIGRAGGFGWEPVSEEGSVAFLDAVTLAFWGAKNSKRKPGKVQRFL